MTISHTRRRKTIKQFKRKYGSEWYGHFREFVADLVSTRLGQPIGTLEEMMAVVKLRGVH